MRIRLTLLLLALNGALLAVILYLERAQSTRDLLAQSSQVILDADFLAGLSSVQLSNDPSETPWNLEKIGEGWFVRSPFDWKANPFAVDQLLYDLHNLRWESRFKVADLATASQSLASYGLDQPRVELILTSLDKTLRLAFGTPTEIGNRVYLLSPDQSEVLVVDKSALAFLATDPASLLNPDIFSLRQEEIKGVQIQDLLANNTRVRLEKRADSWGFVSPVQTTANPDAVIAFLDQWSRLQTTDFRNASTDFPDSEQENLRFSIEATGQRETLLIKVPDDPAEPYLAKREGYDSAFRIRGELVESLRSVQRNLREKRILRPYAGDWSSLDIQFRSLNVTLQQLENGAWQVLHRDASGQLLSFPADSQAITDLRDLMETMEAQGFVTDAPSSNDLERFDLLDPQRLVLIRKENGQTLQFSVGGLSPDRDRSLLYAKTDSSDSIFLVRPAILSAFSLDPFHYRDRTLYTAPENADLNDLALLDRTQDNTALQLSEDQQAVLRDFLRKARLERLLNLSFADPLTLNDGRVIDWILELKARISSGSDSTSRELSFLISKRIGGNTVLLGDPQTGLVGALPQAMVETIDAMVARFPQPPTDSPPSDTP